MSLNSSKRYTQGVGLNWSSTRKGYEHKHRSGLEGGPESMSKPIHKELDYNNSSKKQRKTLGHKYTPGVPFFADKPVYGHVFDSSSGEQQAMVMDRPEDLAPKPPTVWDGQIEPAESLPRKFPRDWNSEDIRRVIKSKPGFLIAKEYDLAHPGVRIDGNIRSRTLHSVESVIAEQFNWAMLMTMDKGRFISDRLESYTAGNGDWDVNMRYLSALLMADAIPYVWEMDVFKKVTKGKLPRHTIEVKLPFDSVWFTFEDAFQLVHLEGTDHNPSHVDGVLLLNLPGKIRFGILGTEDEPSSDPDMEGMGRPFCFFGDIRHGEVFPDDIPENALEIVHHLLACLSFINSPYGVVEKRGLQRNVRRRVGIEGVGPESTQPRFILLRQPVVKRDEDHQPTTVEWSCRWMVRGHHRNQWIPSSKSHRLIWIASHVKGPEDKPMKLGSTFKVVR